jgi:hypothetical protein
MTTGAGDEGHIVATLRDGSEHVLVLGPDAAAAHVLEEVSAGRSQLLRGWVSVRPPPGSTHAVVSGDEILRLRLVQRPADGATQ